LGVVRKADGLALQKKIIVSKPKEVETGWHNSHEWINLAESSKEGYGSKRAVLPMIG
jgi:purine nucleoside phosphorylase